MINPLFRRHFFLFAGIAVFFLVVSFFLTHIVMSLQTRQMMPPHSSALRFFSKLEGDPKVLFQKLKESEDRFSPGRYFLIDRQGRDVETGREIVSVKDLGNRLKMIETESVIEIHSMMPGPPTMVAKTQSPDYFLVNRFEPPREGGPGGPPPGGPGGPPPPPRIFFFTVGSLFVAILLAIGLSLYIQYSSYRKKAVEAHEALEHIKHGNLKYRLKVDKLDELGPLVASFNQMADEVERLVESLKKTDSARRQLLQDLAHDLRTPIASMKSFTETMLFSGDKVSSEKRQEILSLCLVEVEYFSKLVEDLLFLAQLTEPQYILANQDVDMKDLTLDIVNILKEQTPKLKFKVNLQQGDEFKILGSERLLQRLVRNALVNAASFAQSEVTISISKTNSNKVVIQIEDDGPGFSTRALEEFGQKKSTREVHQDTNAHTTRISVGIGSLIMREICQLHRGSLKARNKSDGEKTTGAVVAFEF